jgi:hypothetical protein
MYCETAGANGGFDARVSAGQVDWRTVDLALRGIARRRAAMDSEEARWLREAEALQIWKPLGMVSALDYMERALGYAPKSAKDRLRVARALAHLPRLDGALADGTLAFSAVRELVRVATPANEADWREAAEGKNLRQIEELVADHQLGDGPTDPKDPEARTHVVRFELAASTFARLRQARQALESEHERSLSDDELVAMLCEAALAGGCDADDGRAKFQVAVTVCERCGQGWQEGAGVRVPITMSTVERAQCDAQHLGSLDGDAPERAHQDVTPAIARFVRRRDGGRCRVPGCRSSRALEIHHIIHREHGGGHEASNLILLCASCHTAHHEGLLVISGTAAALDVRRASSTARAAERLDTSDPGTAFVRRPSSPAPAAEKLDTSKPVTAFDVRRPSSPARAAERLDISDTSAAFDVRRPSSPARAAERLDISDTSAAFEVIRPDASERPGPPAAEGRDRVDLRARAAHVGRPDRDAIAPSVRDQARQALVTSGWSRAIASAAVAAAEAALAVDGLAGITAADEEAVLRRLIIEALRICPQVARG